MSAPTAPAQVRVRRPRDGFAGLTLTVALVVPAVLLLVTLVLVQQSAPSIRHSGLGFLTATHWNPVKSDFGALTFIYGTVVTSALALLMALPVGVGIAIFLAEPGMGRVRGVLGLGVELLAAIPSVVYGLWALYVMAPFVLVHLEIPISAALGSRFGIFAGPARLTNLFAASLVVGVMILPTLAAISREVIRAVPGGLREAGFALGATWWETIWRVILPAARAGIFGATVLALGRALGETIAVTMVIGNRPEIAGRLFAPAYTIASVIANEFTEATGQLYSAALIELGLVLVGLTLIVNLAALVLVRRSTLTG